MESCHLYNHEMRKFFILVAVKKIIFDQRELEHIYTGIAVWSQKPKLRPRAPLMLLALPKINRSCRLTQRCLILRKERVGFNFWRKWLPRSARERRANSSWAGSYFASGLKEARWWGASKESHWSDADVTPSTSSVAAQSPQIKRRLSN